MREVDPEEVQFFKTWAASRLAGHLTMLHLQGKSGTASLKPKPYAINPLFEGDCSTKYEWDAVSVVAGVVGCFREHLNVCHDKLYVIADIANDWELEAGKLAPSQLELVPQDEDELYNVISQTFFAIYRQLTFFDWVVGELVANDRISAKAAGEAWERLKNTESYRIENIRSVRIRDSAASLIRWVP